MKNLTQFLLPAMLLFGLLSCNESEPIEDTPGVIHPDRWPTTDGGIPIDPAIEARIDELLPTLTDEELVGQIIQGDINSITPDDVRKYRLGSVLNGGNSAPNADVRAPAEAWVALADEFWEASMDTSGGGKAIPLLWGTDAVHGHNNVPGATVFPHNIGLGAANNPDLIREIGEVTAKEVLATGLDWTFAPTLAVVRDDRWGRTYEGYSEDPEIVARYSAAMVEGLQGKKGTDAFLGEGHVLATAKHFLGDGGTVDGEDQGDNQAPESEFRDIHGAGYPPAIEAGAQTVMASFSSWYGQKMHGSKALLTDVLKEQMSFNGFVVGDWNGHGQLPNSDNTNAPAALLAGLDMYMAPDSWKGLYENTLAQVKSGEIPRERLLDAVRRILRVKFRMGLFEKPKPSERPLSGNFDLIGGDAHLDVARRAVRQSLVLLKNNKETLPIDPAAHILVAGNGANDIGKQSGGWTLSWQGTGNSREDFPNGQSIWDGIQHWSANANGKAVLSPDGSYTEKPDVAIVVFGEDPYAEFMGDRDHLDYPADDGLNLLKKFKADGISTVAVFLSGRPLWVNPELNVSDAFVAAWLPGSQGMGVADVLLAEADGSVRYDFRGKLTFSWPRNAMQTALNKGDADYDPLFPYGYGLSYSDQVTVETLPEESGLEGISDDAYTFFEAGKGSGQWRLQGAGEGTQILVVDALTKVGEALTIRSVDRNAQEDAKQASWSGSGEAQVALIGPATDFSRQSNGDMALSIQYKVDRAPEAPVYLFVAMDDDRIAALDVTNLMNGAPQGEWVRSDILLSCFAEAGADMEQLAAIFGLRTSGKFTINFSDVRLMPNEGKAICP